MCYWGDAIVKIFSKFVNCPTDQDEMSVCLGLSLITRVSVSLFVLHIILMTLLLTRDSFAKYVNENCLLLKFILIIAMTIVLMFVDNNSLLFYVNFASVFSTIFLLYQSIVLIDFGYSWNDLWMDKYIKGTTFYGILLILATCLLSSGTCYLLFATIKNFWIEGCGYNKFSIISNILMIILFLVLVLLKLNPDSSIMTGFFVSMIYTYFNGTSLSSIADKSCNPFIENKNPFDKIFYSFFFHIFANLILGYITTLFVSISEKSANVVNQVNLNLVHRVAEDEGETDSQTQALQPEEKQKEGLLIYKTNHYIFFHLMMAMFSLYLVMIFFDWRELNMDFDNWISLQSTSTSGFWIKTVNSLIFVLIYVWTLVAPSILSEREFQ